MIFCFGLKDEIVLNVFPSNIHDVASKNTFLNFLEAFKKFTVGENPFLFKVEQERANFKTSLSKNMNYKFS